MSSALASHHGGCHCGAVTFSVQAPVCITAQLCNCSICVMSGFLHLIVPKAQFSLKTGEEQLTSYQFNSKTANHLFCKVCGVKSFYIPRSNPNGVSINVNCIKQATFEEIIHEDFDGENWEANVSSLTHLA